MSIRIILLTAFVGLLFALTVLANDPSLPVEGVTDLTQETFKELVGKDRYALIDFYAPWCGHCKDLAPIYEMLGALVKSTNADSKILIAKVDCTKEESLFKELGLQGFPTIMFYKPHDAVGVEFNPPGRQLQAFVDKINSDVEGVDLNTPSNVDRVMKLNPGNFEKVIKGEQSVMVKFYAPWCGHCKAMAKDYKDLADALLPDADKVIIAEVNADEEQNKELAKKYKITGYPTILFFPKGKESSPETYGNARSLSALLQFINEKTGTTRREDGSLYPFTGIDDKVKTLIGNLMNSIKKSENAEKTKTHIQDITNYVNKKYGEKLGKVYAMISKRVAADATYVKEERTRLERILAGKLSIIRKDELSLKQNILTLFGAKDDTEKKAVDGEL